jgi:hypothetical protein
MDLQRTPATVEWVTGVFLLRDSAAVPAIT